MARTVKHVWLEVWTRWGTVSVQVPEQTWLLATSYQQGHKEVGAAGARDHICIQVKKDLNHQGARVTFVKWVDMRITTVRSEDPVPTPGPKATPRQRFDAQVAQHLEQATQLAPTLF